MNGRAARDGQRWARGSVARGPCGRACPALGTRTDGLRFGTRILPAADPNPDTRLLPKPIPGAREREPRLCLPGARAPSRSPEPNPLWGRAHTRSFLCIKTDPGVPRVARTSLLIHGRGRARPGIGLGKKPVMRVGSGVSPGGSVVDSAQAKRFRISQLELRGCDRHSSYGSSW